jgi:hypothetical protein
MICTNCGKWNIPTKSFIDTSKLFNCPKGIVHVCSSKCKEELIVNLKDGSHWTNMKKIKKYFE